MNFRHLKIEELEKFARKGEFELGTMADVLQVPEFCSEFQSKLGGKISPPARLLQCRDGVDSSRLKKWKSRELHTLANLCTL